MDAECSAVGPVETMFWVNRLASRNNNKGCREVTGECYVSGDNSFISLQMVVEVI
jgi:hypothetical protein